MRIPLAPLARSHGTADTVHGSKLNLTAPVGIWQMPRLVMEKGALQKKPDFSMES
jgi:hypothetical protein